MIHLGLSLRELSPLTLIQKMTRRVDPALPSGSTSKTWDPTRSIKPFGLEILQSQGPAASASQGMPSTKWRPRLRAERDMSSITGDTSESSTAGPRLGSIDEISFLDEEALRTLQERGNQALASTGDSR